MLKLPWYNFIMKYFLALLLSLNSSIVFGGWLDEIKKLPSIGDATIQSGTIIVYPDPSYISESSYRGLANVLCGNASAQGFNTVRFMDSVAYLNSGKHKVHSRHSC
jgi:hypothetical protein